MHQVTIRGLLTKKPEETRGPQSPLFSGKFQVVGEHGSFSGACWQDIARKGASAGKPYLSLLLEPLGPDGKTYPLRGWLFEAENKASEKSCDYYGQVKIGPPPDSSQGETLRVMRVAAWRRASGQYLSVLIEPERD